MRFTLIFSLFFPLALFAGPSKPTQPVFVLMGKCMKYGFSASDVEYLIKDVKTFDINARDESNQTLLMLCTMKGRASEVNILLENGAMVNDSDNGTTALHLAAHLGHEPIVWRLLKSGANKSLKDGFGLTPEDYANRAGYTKIVEILGGRPSNLFVDEKRKEAYAILESAFKGEISVSEFKRAFAPFGPLIDEPFYKGQWTILHMVVAPDKAELLNAVIKLKANINIIDFPDGNTPLHYAVKLNNFAAVKILLDAGADPELKNAKGETPLDYGQKINEKIIPMYIKAIEEKTKKDKNKQEMIIGYLKNYKTSSKWKNKMKKYESQLNEEINKKKIEESGQPDLNAKMAKAAADKKEREEALAKFNKPFPDRTTPRPAPPMPAPRPIPQPSKVIPFPKLLEAAANSIESGNPKGLSWALDNGLPPDARLPNGNPILLAACFYGNFSALQTLITRGANINNKGVDGFTPLMTAVRGYKYPLVEYLVKIGADRRLRNNFNWTAFDFARQNRDERLMFLTRF